MKFYRILLFILVILVITLLNACRTDEFSETIEQNPISGEVPLYTTGSLSGLVIDAELHAIANAEIELNGQITTTGENGVFIFNDISALTTGSLVKIRKEGYFDGFKLITMEPEEQSILKINMVKESRVGSFASTNAVTLDVNGAKLSLPANGYTYENGTAYSGVINVNAHWYDPTDEQTITSMPGDLRGLDQEGTPVQLTTYGMMAVELYSAQGETLQLDTNSKAQLTFPLPPNSQAPTSIPMWHFDEETGVWIEEGIAKREGADMVGEVTHFSFWNCDVPDTGVRVKGRVVSSQLGLTSLSGLTVVITDLENMISGYGTTNKEGIFSGMVPIDRNLSMSIYSCGDLVSIYDIGILSQDSDLGDMLIDVNNQIHVSATLLDCDLSLLHDGGAIITTENSIDLVAVNRGQVNHIVFSCATDKVFVQGWNNRDGEFSSKREFDIDGATVQCGAITVCGGAVAKGIRFSLGGSAAISLSDVTVSIVDDTFIHIYAEQEGGGDDPFYIDLLYYLEGRAPLTGNLSRIAMAVKPDQGTYNARKWDSASDPYRQWQKNDGYQIGDILVGSSVTEDASFQYVVSIDQIVNSSSVTGRIWNDTNQNGILDSAEEMMIVNSGLTLVPKNTSRFGNWGLLYYYYDLSVVIDGTFEIKGLIPGIEYILSVDNQDGHLLSPRFQGSNTSRDCDFYDDPNFLLGRENWLTDPFTLEVDQNLENVGLGIYK